MTPVFVVVVVVVGGGGAVGSLPFPAAPYPPAPAPAPPRAAPPPPTPPGIALATRLASSSTNTTSGRRSRTILPARAADDEDMWAVPSMCTVRNALPPPMPPPPSSYVLAHVDTDGSHNTCATPPPLGTMADDDDDGDVVLALVATADGGDARAGDGRSPTIVDDDATTPARIEVERDSASRRSIVFVVVVFVST